MRDLPRTWGIGAAAIALAVALGGCSTSEPTPEGELSSSAQVVEPPFEVLPLALETTDGDSFSLTEDTDRALTVVFFGYTNCPDICGQVMSTMAGAVNRLDEADLERLDMVFVTTDPARDTAEVVSDYVAQYDDEFIGVTGKLDDIVAVARTVGVGVDQGEKLPSGGYDITHGTQIIGINGDDEAGVYWRQDVSQAQLADDIHTLLARN